jgi:hypothetical protein
MFRRLGAPPTRTVQDAATRRARFTVAAVVGAASLMAFIVMRPEKIFLANTPTGGDMGAHVLIPAYIRDVLIPSGRVMGWSNDWYAGFPVNYFYFPLPALTIVFLDLFLPYGVAFKLVTVAGLVALPIASYYFARSMGFARPVALVGGVAGSTFMFMETFSIFGGNTLSTLAGEYSFSWSFALSLVYLGMLIRNTREGRGFTVGPAVVLAMAALSHVITTFVVVVASLPLLLRRRGPRVVLGAWGLGFALAGFWAVPLLARVRGFTSDMGWNPVGDLWQVFPRDLWPVMVLGAAGLAWSVAKRLTVGPIVTMAVFCLVGFFIIQQADWTKLYNARLLPFWYYAVFLFAGLFVGMALMALVGRLHQTTGAVWGAALAGSLLFLSIAGVGISKAPAWSAWNYSGYEGKPAYPEYRALMEAIDILPPGRVMWEANHEENKYGTPMALMLTGYWSPGHPSMEGLLFESSLTTPFHFLNAAEVSKAPSNPVGGLKYHQLDFTRATAHLALYNVAYYVSYTPEAAEAARTYGLEVLAEVPPFVVFALPESSLVDIAAFEPVVWAGQTSFSDAALAWYDDITGLDKWLASDGPDDWQRVESVDADSIREPIAGGGEVTDIVLSSHRISFHTTAVGVPHMVKVSDFPNWKAIGADGPYRVAPSVMMVIPSQEEVVIEFRNTWAENLGMALTGAGLMVLAGIGAVRLVRRLRRPASRAARVPSGS